MPENTAYLNNVLRYNIDKVSQQKLAADMEPYRNYGLVSKNRIHLVPGGLSYHIGFIIGKDGAIYGYAPFPQGCFHNPSAKDAEPVAKQYKLDIKGGDSLYSKRYLFRKLPNGINLADMKEAAIDLIAAVRKI